jgi:hypothetical protein
MATLNEIAYDILTTAKPYLSDDTRVTIDHVKYWIRVQRALLIRNELNKFRTIDEDIKQTLCIDVVNVDRSECCDIPLGCNIVRTTEKIPTTIELHTRPAITRVASVDMIDKPFTFVDRNRVPYVGSGKFDNKLIYAFLHNGYIYIYSKNILVNGLSKIIVEGVFENPEDLSQFNNCISEEDKCYSDDMRYPVKEWMIPYMKDYVLKSNLAIAIESEIKTGDTQNNSKSDVKL